MCIQPYIHQHTSKHPLNTPYTPHIHPMYSNTGNAGPFLAYNRPSGYGGVGGWFKKDIEVWACLLEAAYVFNKRVNMV